MLLAWSFGFLSYWIVWAMNLIFCELLELSSYLDHSAFRLWRFEVRLWSYEAMRQWGWEALRLWGYEVMRLWGCEATRLLDKIQTPSPILQAFQFECFTAPYLEDGSLSIPNVLNSFFISTVIYRVAKRISKFTKHIFDPARVHAVCVYWVPSGTQRIALACSFGNYSCRGNGKGVRAKGVELVGGFHPAHPRNLFKSPINREARGRDKMWACWGREPPPASHPSSVSLILDKTRKTTWYGHRGPIGEMGKYVKKRWGL